MANLILLKDEKILHAELSDFLDEQGHCVDTVDDIEELKKKYLPGKHQIALIDLGLPDEEGLNLIVHLRESGEQLDIIVIPARSGSRNRAEGFVQGADHYLCKHFDLGELTVTVTALARRFRTGSHTPRWVLDTLRCHLIPRGKAPISLSSQGYILVRSIVVGEGKPVSRRKIVEALGENFLQYDQRRRDNQMHRLHKIVFDASAMELPVRAVRGRGYQMGARVDLCGWCVASRQ